MTAKFKTICHEKAYFKNLEYMKTALNKHCPGSPPWGI
jgi:hypothetical protein